MKDKIFYNPADGNDYQIQTVFKNSYRVRTVGQNFGIQKTVKKEETVNWKEHQYPAKVRVGDKLIRHGQIMKIVGLNEIPGHATVLGDWDGKGKEHENLIPMCQDGWGAYGALRLPFEDEVTI